MPTIQGAEKNIGSEALSAWMFHEASKPNPFGLLGAMFIIEGLGSIKAQEWGRLAQTPARPARGCASSSCSITARTTPSTCEEFEEMLRMVLPDDAVATADRHLRQVTARLYALQIEEIVA